MFWLLLIAITVAIALSPLLFLLSDSEIGNAGWVLLYASVPAAVAFFTGGMIGRFSKYFVLLLLLGMFGVNSAQAQQVIFSTKNGPVGRIAQRMTGDYYTHSAIVLNGWVYEQDWPRAKKTPLWRYGKRRTINDVYSIPVSQYQVNQMQRYAESRMGEPYRLRNYFWPNSRPVHGTWCSPFVGQVLNAGGYNLSPQQYYEPENLRQAIRPSYQYRFYR